ncbi:MAG: hypothetical protein WC417_03360 [Candidatus Omnitrophota bacterium]|jgi:hypothetical protein
MARLKLAVLAVFVFLLVCSGIAFASPTTLIWAPSTDIQPYGKIHLNADVYVPVKSRDHNDNELYVQQVYGPTFSLLSDKPENNLLGKLWSPLGKVMAETGFDYKKGFGPLLDRYPVYFHFKLGVPEDAYFKYMPAFAVGSYDMGYKHNRTDNNVWYLRGAKTFSLGKLNLGRFSAGYFNGNAKLLLDKDGKRDNAGAMIAWERVMTEISDKLWVCVDYQGTQSSYGAMNYGFSWKFTNNISAILGYEIYNNPNAKNTVTFQLDVDF